MRLLVASLAVLACSLFLVSCGDEEQPPADGGTTSFEITFEGGRVSPSGAEATVPQGSDVELVVEADEPGVLHVHSSPEQQLSYAAGTTTVRVALADQPPGVIDIESHDLDEVVLRLEIR
ncbi:hypothetical protein [Nocardioides dongkuii]|uniref:hypothetical protein n=1 Tax=Nocardioides dongkuii TaxID=2760089 RepID=UPI0015FADFB2|nr:hypothetical protein [Nocardioides dongkuii]